MGTVCASFCWINSYTHQRCLVNPLGRQDLPHVGIGNLLAEHSCFLALVAWPLGSNTQCYMSYTAHVLIVLLLRCRGCTFSIENPRGSMLQEHPHFQFMIRFLQELCQPLYRQARAWCFSGHRLHSCAQDRALLGQLRRRIGETHLDLQPFAVGPTPRKRNECIFQRSCGAHVSQRTWI